MHEGQARPGERLMDPIEEVGELMEALRDGTIEDGQVARLDQLLAEYPEALDHFVDRAWLGADLKLKLGTAPALPSQVRRRTWMPLAAAAAVLIAGLLLLTPRTRRDEAANPSYEGCAVLSRALEPKWEEGAG